MARREIKVERPTADALHQALARAPREGLMVRLPAGRITLDRPVELPSATTLVGAGRGQTVLVGRSGLDTALLASGGHHITVRDLTITWPAEAAAAGSFEAAACSFRGTDHLTIRNVEVQGPPTTAVWFDRCTHVRVDQLHVGDAGGTGLLATACRHLDVEHTTVGGAGLHHTAAGVHLDGVQEARLQVDARGASSSAVLLDATSGPVAEVVVRATATHSQRGLSAMASAAHRVQRVTLTGTFSDNRADGILLVNADRVVVVDAVVERNGEHGIVLDGRTGSRNCAITSTVVRDCGVTFAELGGSRDNAIAALEPLPPPATPTAPDSSLRALPGRARRSFVYRARRAERAAQRVGRRAPRPVRRSLGRARTKAKQVWRGRRGPR